AGLIGEPVTEDWLRTPRTGQIRQTARDIVKEVNRVFLSDPPGRLRGYDDEALAQTAVLRKNGLRTIRLKSPETTDPKGNGSANSRLPKPDSLAGPMIKALARIWISEKEADQKQVEKWVRKSAAQPGTLFLTREEVVRLSGGAVTLNQMGKERNLPWATRLERLLEKLLSAAGLTGELGSLWKEAAPLREEGFTQVRIGVRSNKILGLAGPQDEKETLLAADQSSQIPEARAFDKTDYLRHFPRDREKIPEAATHVFRRELPAPPAASPQTVRIHLYVRDTPTARKMYNALGLQAEKGLLDDLVLLRPSVEYRFAAVPLKENEPLPEPVYPGVILWSREPDEISVPTAVLETGLPVLTRAPTLARMIKIALLNHPQGHTLAPQSSWISPERDGKAVLNIALTAQPILPSPENYKNLPPTRRSPDTYPLERVLSAKFLLDEEEEAAPDDEAAGLEGTDISTETMLGADWQERLLKAARQWEARGWLASAEAFTQPFLEAAQTARRRLANAMEMQARAQAGLIFLRLDEQKLEASAENRIKGLEDFLLFMERLNRGEGYWNAGRQFVPSGPGRIYAPDMLIPDSRGLLRARLRLRNAPKSHRLDVTLERLQEGASRRTIRFRIGYDPDHDFPHLDIAGPGSSQDWFRHGNLTTAWSADGNAAAARESFEGFLEQFSRETLPDLPAAGAAANSQSEQVAAGLEQAWAGLRSAITQPQVVVVEMGTIPQELREPVTELAGVEPNLMIYAGLETAAALAGMDVGSVRFIGSAETEQTLTGWLKRMAISLTGERPGPRLLLQILEGLGVPTPAAQAGVEAIEQALETASAA
ncbi:MAG: hypothetical protein COV76_02275, partial [Candidatus Omnitrophica bacterium CG11_big_fil_rev_8_21_14_0_20_64_10]